MGRRKIKKDIPIDGEKSGLKDETFSMIVAVIFFVLFIISVLASLGMAGAVGDKVYEWFGILFGLGYY